MPRNLLEHARQNRITALKTLEQRKRNIFYLDDARRERERRAQAPMFVSTRTVVLLPEQLAA